MTMLLAIRQEIVPVIIVVVLLAVWTVLQLRGGMVPDDVKTLVTAIVTFYFGARTGGAAAARALNGAAHGLTE